MPEKQRAALVLGVLLVILAFHMAIAWQDMATLSSNGFLYDDSFYAFKIAQNIADGKGMTFDGIHPTTGFQPLYVFLLVPAFMISGGNLVLPIHIALSMLALFTVMTSYLIYRIASRYVDWVPSLLAAVLWAFSPIVTKQSANGLETAIAAFMIALSVFYYLDSVRSRESVPKVRFLILGVILGLAVLSRIDGTFLVMAISLDYLFLLRRKKASARMVVHLALIAAGVLVFYGPWLLVNILESGSPLQDSGTATRFLSLAYASYFHYGEESLALKGPNFPFLWAHIGHTLAALKVIPQVHVIFRLLERAGMTLGAKEAFQMMANIMGFLFLLFSGIAVRRWSSEKSRASRGEIGFLALFCGLLMLAYTFYIFGAFFFLRYYYPLYLTASIYFAFLLQDLFDWMRKRRAVVRKVLVATGAGYLVLFGFFAYSQAFRSIQIYPFYDIASWIEKNTDKDDRIGVFQCGMIGYLSDRQIINLDGKVNRDALAALKGCCLDKYIEKENIDIVVDHSQIIRIFLDISPEMMRTSCAKILPVSQEKPSGWIAVWQGEAAENKAGLITPGSGPAASAGGYFRK